MTTTSTRPPASAIQASDWLVAAPARWDEACFALPALRALQGAGLGVGVLCQESQRELWQSLAGLEVCVIAPKEKPKAVAAAIRGAWQAALIWEPGVAAEAIKLAGVARRVGPRLPGVSQLLTQSLVLAESPHEHRVRHYLAVVEEMGVATRDAGFFAPVDLAVDAPAADVLLLSPDSDFGPSHEWPLDRWIEIGQRLLAAGRAVTVAGLPGQRGQGRALANALGSAAGFLGLPAFTGAMAELAGFPRLLAVDSSLPHLAAHVGATCVTLFGPNDPAWKRPLGRRHCVLRRHVECAPCLLAKCPLDMRCQRELDVDRVWAAIDRRVDTRVHQANER